ncbi:pancreatic elastase I [Sarotherodon galilaeus]
MTEFNSVNRGKSVGNVSLLQPDKMLEEMGTLDCRHLKLPLVTLENLGKVITPYVKDVSQDQWASLADGDPGSKVVILLSSMCHAVIEEISALVLEVVEPQVLAKGHNHASGDKVSLQDGCSCCRVTENNIQASFRNTLHHCFGEALSMAQGKSYNSDILVKLFSAEITKKVNTSLARITGPVPTPKTHDSVTALILAYQENSSPSLESPDCPVNMTFLTVLLAKLVDHIASKTRTSILNVDLVELLGGVTMRAEKELDSIPPPSVENLHIPIYKKLCKVFGSKYLLQAAMESGFSVTAPEIFSKVKEFWDHMESCQGW